MSLLPATLLAAVALTGSPAVSSDDWIVDEVLVRSPEQRPVTLLTLAAPGDDAQGCGPHQRPAVLIVAGLDGRDTFSTSLARSLARELVQRHRELLEGTTVYVVPNLNPDGLAGFQTRTPIFDFGGRLRPTDADRDRRVAEDGANDLNGDGLITAMRVKDPGIDSGLVARYVLDPDDPRLLKEADAEEGEIANYAMLSEGIDDDGDGEYGEDGPGGDAGSGITLDRDFPALWPALSDGVDWRPLSQPETRALADWMLGRPNIVAVLTLGDHENLGTKPEAGKFDPTGRVPIGIEKGDAHVYEKLGEAFRDATGITGGETPETAGAFHHWAYAHLGLYSFATRGWARSDLVKDADEAEEGDESSDDGEPASVSEGSDPKADLSTSGESLELSGLQLQWTSGSTGGVTLEGLDEVHVSELNEVTIEPARPGSKRRDGGSKTEDGKWLNESDARDGAGFVDWQAFEHPQLGAVEIGGFVPGFRRSPPRESWAAWNEKNLTFLTDLLARMPRLEISTPRVERLGPGLWRVRIQLSNTGGLPTTSAMGVKCRRLHPIVCALEVHADQLLEGRVVQSVPAIAPGSHEDVTWTLFADDGSDLDLDVRLPGAPWRHFDLVLEEQR